MWQWLKKQWNYWTGGEKAAPPPAYHPPHFTPPRNALPLSGHIWMMDPETHIATRMVAVADPTDKNHGFKLVSTGERARIPASSTHPDGHGHFVRDPMPAGGTVVNGIPVFARRAGHLVAALDAGHGVDKHISVRQRDGSLKSTTAYDIGSKSVGSKRAGPKVTEDVINLHFAQDAAVAFARNGWDTIITRSRNEPKEAGNGFAFRIDAANQADVYLSLHADQRLGDPNAKPRNEAERQAMLAARERHAVQAKAEELRAQGKGTAGLSDHEKAVLADIDRKTGMRVYIDRRIGPDDHSLAFGKYLATPHKANDAVQDGFVRRPGYQMINGEKIRGPLSVLLEPGAIDIAHDEAHLRSRNYRQAFAQRLVEKTETFLFQCMPDLRAGKQPLTLCTEPFEPPRHGPEPKPAAKAAAPEAKPTHEQHPPAEKKAKKPEPEKHPHPPAAKPAHDKPKPAASAKPDGHRPAHPPRVADLARLMEPHDDKKRHPAKHQPDDHPHPPGPTPGKKPSAPVAKRH